MFALKRTQEAVILRDHFFFRLFAALFAQSFASEQEKTAHIGAEFSNYVSVRINSHQRTISTGRSAWLSTFCVSLPSSSAPKVPSPRLAITI